MDKNVFNIKKVLLFIFLIPISIDFYSCGIKYVLEEEPNNNIYNASSVYNGKLVKSTIANKDDIDFYRIQVKEVISKDLLADIEVKENTNLNLIIKVYKENKIIKIIKNDSLINNKTKTVRIVNMLFNMEDVINGIAIFSVEPDIGNTSFDTSEKLNYDLLVRLKEKGEDEEGEANDKAVFANPIGDSGIIKGYFNPSWNPLNIDDAQKREEDWYSFIISGEGLKILNISVSAVPNIDTKLSIYDDMGYLIRETNGNKTGETEKIMNLGVKKGKYYIKLENDKPYVQNPYVGYLLKIEKYNWDKYSEYEPNDRYSFANSITFSKDIKGYINPPGDIDWFRFNIYDPERQVITVKLSPTAYIDPVIELYNSSNESILFVNDRKIDEGEIIKNLGVEEGVYYLKISNKAGDTDNFNNPYTLLIEKKDWNQDEEFELNNDFDNANQILVGEIRKGYINPARDKDFYWFIIEEDMEINYEVTPCVLLDMVLKVYNQNKEIVLEINNNKIDEGENGKIDLLKGKYFLEVFSNNKNANSRDSYMLKIFG